MKKKTVILIFLGLILGKSISADDLSVFLGVAYNPLNLEYIMGMGSLVLDRYFGDYDDRHSVIIESRISYGLLTYRFEAPNPFTVQMENTELWVKGSVFETTLSAIYQYVINDVIGLRFGLALPVLWSGAFYGEKPGLTGKGSSLAVTIGVNGLSGVVIFPAKKIPIVVTVSPGVVLDPYLQHDILPFTLPVSISFGWNGIIDN